MADALYYVALGGAGEIGMNAYLYGHGPERDPDWLLVDCGITFANGNIPGVDVILPDLRWLEERKERLRGLVLTHAHEDHIGAVAYLWRNLCCPIYATPFTAAVLRAKLLEHGLLDRVELHEIALSGSFQVGPFKLRYITVTHSIPEPNSLLIETPSGRVLHTGDFKFDPGPVIGETTDFDALRQAGDDGVSSLIIDSTNVFSEGEGESEASLLADFETIIKSAPGRVLVTCFASNVARLRTIITAAEKSNRVVCLVGRSLHRIAAAARETGYLNDVAEFIDEREALILPSHQILYISTGCQGEPRAALSKIAGGDHPWVELDPGDRVIFSSRVIPGNELSVERLQNTLSRNGVEISTWRDAHVHVSGHPARGELKRMYDLIRPDSVIPMHGEYRHLCEQARWAESCGAKRAMVAENGALLRLQAGGPVVIDEVPVGRFGLDGKRMIELEGEVVRGRSRVNWNGILLVSLVIDKKGRLCHDPVLSTQGLIENTEQELLNDASAAAIDALQNLSHWGMADDEIKQAARIAVRRIFRESLGKKPVTHIHLLRL